MSFGKFFKNIQMLKKGLIEEEEKNNIMMNLAGMKMYSLAHFCTVFPIPKLFHGGRQIRVNAWTGSYLPVQQKPKLYVNDKNCWM